MKSFNQVSLFTFVFLLSSFCFVYAQEQPPEPTAPRAVKIPNISENKLPNGMKVVVVERKNVPLVSVEMLINIGAGSEDSKTAGLVNMMASLLTKGTTTRSATAIAEQMEFLGSGLNSNSNWNSTTIEFNSTTDKMDAAMTIFSDVILRPTFPASEINLFKNQTIDELKANLQQPGTLGRFVAARYSFGEHIAIGTPETIKSITRLQISNVYKSIIKPKNAVLIFTGDITTEQANSLAKKYFAAWKNPPEPKANKKSFYVPEGNIKFDKTLSRILVIDLPNSGQASVSYNKKLNFGRLEEGLYYPASVMNSLLGGGYSSRMNQEIRIKRGLSYGAGSAISWRKFNSNFATRCQTKTVSAAEVAELTINEINRLADSISPDAELTPRKNVLNGDFGRNFESNDGITGTVAELFNFGLPANELDSFMGNTEKVSAEQIKSFSGNYLKGGDIIIVGDYNDFKADLAKRFPNQKIEVIKASELDLNSDTLKKK